MCFEARSICTIHWTIFNIPYLIAFSSTATSAGKAAETKTNDILAMISPEGERVGLTKVINIIISFFVNEKTLCCPFDIEIKGRFPKVRTGRFEILSCSAMFVYIRVVSPPPPPNSPINARAPSLGPRLSLFSEGSYSFCSHRQQRQQQQKQSGN